MKQFLLCLTVAITGALVVNATIQNGTGQFLTSENLKFEILESENPEVGVAVQDSDCPIQIVLPSTIEAEDENGEKIIYTVTQINAEAFKDNASLVTIEFPNTIKEIGKSAFDGCESLKFDELPEGLISIGENAFKGCKSLKRIKLPETTQTLGVGAFCEMPNLKRAILFSEVKELPDNLFENDTELEEVYLPGELLKIGNRVFFNVLSMENIQIPATVEEIGEQAFYGGGSSEGREGLHHIKLPSSVNNLSQGSFEFAGLLSADLSETEIEDFPDNVFSSCYELREVKFPSNLKSIGERAFLFCAPNSGMPMMDIILPPTVETIKENAFYRACITKLEIGDLVTDLPKGSCGRPQILTLGEGITNIGDHAIDFLDLKILTIMAPEPPTLEGEITRFDWDDEDGIPLTAEEKNDIILFVKDEEAKTKYEMSEIWKDFHIMVLNEDLVSVTIEEGETLEEVLISQQKNIDSIFNLQISGTINEEDYYFMRDKMFSLMYLDLTDVLTTEIPNDVFKNKRSLKKVILPKDLKIIGNSAFHGCSNLEIDNLPETIEYIGDQAFFQCTKLNISKMPDALIELGLASFYDCNSLRTLTFGENLENLNHQTFHTCANLEYVDLSKTKIKELGNQTFIHAFALTTLLLPPTLETIGYESISVTGLTSLDLPSSLKKIDDSGISRTKIRTLNFSENLIELAENALANNVHLLTVNLPASLQYISESAFSGDKKISAISCYSETAPEATSATFEDINTSKCVLSVPANSLDSYLEAEGWNLFSNIENTLEVNIPEDVDITTIPEEDYQDLLEEFEMGQKLANTSDGEKDEEEGNDTPPLSTRAGTSLTHNASIPELLTGNLFCRLMHGSVIASEENNNSKGHRIFIFTKNDEKITSVKVNDMEMIDQMVGNSLVLPHNTIGTLSINGGNSAIKTNFIEIQENNDNVYDITGRLIINKATLEQINQLPRGLYIIKGKKVVIK